MEFLLLLMSLFGFTEAEAVEVVETETQKEIIIENVDPETGIVILPGESNEG